MVDSSSCCTSPAGGLSLIQNANMARGAVGSCTWRQFPALKQTNCCPSILAVSVCVCVCVWQSLSVLSRILSECCFFTAVCHLAVAQMQSAGNNLSHFLASMIWRAGWGNLVSYSTFPSWHFFPIFVHNQINSGPSQAHIWNERNRRKSVKDPVLK